MKNTVCHHLGLMEPHNKGLAKVNNVDVFCHLLVAT